MTRDPYSWVDESGRALRRSRRMLIVLAVWDAVIIAWIISTLRGDPIWWVNAPLVLGMLAVLAQAVRAHLRWVRTHDRSLLARERHRMGLSPDE